MDNFLILMIGIAFMGFGAYFYFRYKDKHP